MLPPAAVGCATASPVSCVATRTTLQREFLGRAVVSQLTPRSKPWASSETAVVLPLMLPLRCSTALNAVPLHEAVLTSAAHDGLSYPLGSHPPGSGRSDGGCAGGNRGTARGSFPDSLGRAGRPCWQGSRKSSGLLLVGSSHPVGGGFCDNGCDNGGCGTSSDSGGRGP